MSYAEPMDYEPDDVEQSVLDVIREEGRVNPMRVRERTDIRKQYVNDALRQLTKLGVLEKVNRGLYQYVPENDDLDGAPDESPQQATDDDPDVERYETRIDELEGDLARADDEIEELRARGTGDVDVDALANLQDCFERGLEELPDDVPGRGSIEDCQTLLERVIGDE